MFDALSDDDKKDAAKVKKTLEAAFTPSTADCYRMFVAQTIRWGDGGWLCRGLEVLVGEFRTYHCRDDKDSISDTAIQWRAAS